VPNRSPHDSDFLFAEQCLGGNLAALQELQNRQAHAAAAFLRNAGVPSADAEETVTELMSELVAADGPNPPLLAQFHGQCALETWLNRAALSRAISRRRSEERYRRRLETVEFEGILRPYEAESPDDAEAFLRQLLREAIQQAMTDCPGDDYVILHLLFGSKLHATEVARMFRCDWRTLRDRAEAACAQVRFTIQAELQRRDPWLNLSWSEIIKLLTPDLPPLFDGQPAA